MSGSRTTPPVLKKQQDTRNKGKNNVTDEQIAHETYGSNTSMPIPSVIDNNENEPILMEDTVRDSEELALTAKDDIENAKIIVSQQEKLEKKIPNIVRPHPLPTKNQETIATKIT